MAAAAAAAGDSMQDVLSDTPSQGEFARRDVTILPMPRFGVETDLAETVHDVNSYGPKFARDHFTTRRAKTAGQDSVRVRVRRPQNASGFAFEKDDCHFWDRASE